MKQTMAASPSILSRTYHQVQLEVSNILRFGPNVVLSDSALSTILAARLLRIPRFTVLNQLNLANPADRDSAPVRLLSVGTSTAMGRLWQLSNEVLLPDLPPPYTISEKNLWGSNVGRTRYIGFLGLSGKADPDSAAMEFSLDKRSKVFWQVSGPPKTRTAFVKKALEFAEALSERFVFVITGGSPTSTSEATRVPGGWYYGWCKIPEYYFAVCDVVVSRAGHGTIGQAITASKPSLLVPIPRQPEQEGNADKAERLGISVKIKQDDLTLEGVGSSLESLLGQSVSERVKEISNIASSFNAKEEILRTLEAAAISDHP